MAAFPLPAAKTYKPTVEDCIALDMSMLRKNGMLLEFMDHRLQRQWKLGGSLVGDILLSIAFTGDIAYPSLQIDGTCFGQPIMQAVQLVSSTSMGMVFLTCSGGLGSTVNPATSKPLHSSATGRDILVATNQRQQKYLRELVGTELPERTWRILTETDWVIF
jgi:hypothetical protein